MVRLFVGNTGDVGEIYLIDITDDGHVQARLHALDNFGQRSYEVKEVSEEEFNQQGYNYLRVERVVVKVPTFANGVIDMQCEAQE